MKTKTRMVNNGIMLLIMLFVLGSFTSCYKKVFEISGGSTTDATYLLSGIVKDATADTYIKNVNVVVICEDEDYVYSRDSTTTDQYGYYSYNLEHPGKYRICFYSDGYISMAQTVSVEVISRGESAHYPLYVALSKVVEEVTYQTSKYNMTIYVKDADDESAISNFNNLVIKEVDNDETVITPTSISGNTITVEDIPVGVYDITLLASNYYEGHTILRINEVKRQGNPDDIYTVDYPTYMFLTKKAVVSEDKYYIMVEVYDIQTSEPLRADQIRLYEGTALSQTEENKSSYRFEVDPGQYAIEVAKESYETSHIDMNVLSDKPGVLYCSVYLPSSLGKEVTSSTKTGTTVESEVGIISDGTEDTDGDGKITINKDRNITIHSYQEYSDGTKNKFTDYVTIPAGTEITVPSGHEQDSILIWRVAFEEEVEDVRVLRVYKGSPDGTVFNPSFKVSIDDPSGGLPLYMYYRDSTTKSGWEDDYVKDAAGNNVIDNDDITDDLLFISIPHFSEFCINLKITEWVCDTVVEYDEIAYNGYNGTQDTIEANYSIPDYSGVRFDDQTIATVLGTKSFTGKQSNFLNTTYMERIKFYSNGVAPTSTVFSGKEIYKGKITVVPLVQFDKIKITRTLKRVRFKMMNEEDMKVSFSTVISVKFSIDNLQPIGHGRITSGTGVGGGIYISE